MEDVEDELIEVLVWLAGNTANANHWGSCWSPNVAPLRWIQGRTDTGGALLLSWSVAFC